MVSLNNSRQPHKDATRDAVLWQDKRGSKPGFDITVKETLQHCALRSRTTFTKSGISLFLIYSGELWVC
ncbi:MAG: hypothetical protein EAZ78_08725 [Oscillatoriales cyanobacterium]|uniref:Uncharacterized protein n=1 Tax=Microcoleus anatoxicus PTRS2 TaxID=2705321 RepID=A0ABU8YWT2_9CYAN|nr:MAG: hypothetical protein EA000_02255 [Oscillatoriales cyanobacterium]TAD99202.1 MAG: hypothetical protein EAZ96_23415 [Oscillatoriales cyanobacterium]TAE02765.1 MAG: hypothetical protein EAZ98_01085 [Oscillatoriales cyanobacterium]TAF04457.1 MAG: hypothetical protein EAZ78_08725 [Oscillatoriales cyanobacterium]TAF40813.1 MAG: hypothetical protein EAZ68_10880 [Oscillatoriales cyanobacterium]